jgi:hypothetical protein
MTELIRWGKDTKSLLGCSVVKPHYYKKKTGKEDEENDKSK